jgi:hypothetical protein
LKTKLQIEKLKIKNLAFCNVTRGRWLMKNWKKTKSFWGLGSKKILQKVLSFSFGDFWWKNENGVKVVCICVIKGMLWNGMN